MSLIVKETNSYAFRHNSTQNPWKSLSIIKLYHFFGCLLSLALHKHPIHRYLWRNNNGILRNSSISKHRFEQIMSFLHFKDRGESPSSIGANWWDKLDPIMSILRQKSALYWLPSTNITVDEVMIKFEDRTSQKVTISGKPISTGFKIFALANSGYIFNWECTKPGLNKGLLTTKK
jgi:hypothetical protein